jgi:hypothetical protein
MGWGDCSIICVFNDDDQKVNRPQPELSTINYQTPGKLASVKFKVGQGRFSRRIGEGIWQNKRFGLWPAITPNPLS